MLYYNSRHFVLGLILLTVIYRVKSNELNKIDGARKHFFKDIQNFFERIFKPHPAYTRPPDKNNATYVTFDKDKKNTTFKPITTLAYFSERRRIPRINMKNKKYGFQSNLDQNNPHRRADDSGEEIYVTNKKRQSTSYPQKKLIIIVTDKEKVHNEMIAREGLSYLGLSKSFTRDLNQTILRQAFGDACIKVAIRKCYKALRRVNNMVCSTRFKCKSSFKSTFLLKAKSGCITGFDYTGMFSQKKKNKKQKVILNEDMDYNSQVFANEKRKKYVDACIPYMLTKHSNTVRKDIRLGNNLSELVTQILRSESDRRCQKVSKEACVIACNFARDEVCSTYICGRNKKNAFKKECKNECKRSYLIKSDSSESSQSNSG